MTTRMTARMAAALGLAFALVTAACSDNFSLTEPISAPAVSYSQQNDQGEATSQSWGDEDLDSSSSGNEGNEGNQLVQSDLTWKNSVASAVIGRKGGTVTLRAFSDEDEDWQPYHSLKVPAGAVQKRTRFVMELGPDATIDVYLSATEVASGRRITEFKKPLDLRLTYDGSSVAVPDRLTIVHVVDERITEVVESVVNTTRRYVIGKIWHFSRYAVACE